jgi:hypothetical protein
LFYRVQLIFADHWRSLCNHIPMHWLINELPQYFFLLYFLWSLFSFVISSCLFLSKVAWWNFLESIFFLYFAFLKDYACRLYDTFFSWKITDLITWWTQRLCWKFEIIRARIYRASLLQKGLLNYRIWRELLIPNWCLIVEFQILTLGWKT